VEGALSWEMTWDHWQNTKAALSASDELPEFLAANDNYVNEQVAATHLNDDESSFWWQVKSGSFLGVLKIHTIVGYEFWGFFHFGGIGLELLVEHKTCPVNRLSFLRLTVSMP
jgi:hypothetical protein